MIVVGAGGGGMTAALVAALEGLRPLLVEKSGSLGGTTALSAGTLWIPNTHHAGARGIDDTPERALTFLDATVGNHSSDELKRAFLARGPEMIDYLEQRSHVRFRLRDYHPDYLADAEGATIAGRALETLPWDGRRLGRHFEILKPPLPEFTILGGMMVASTDIGSLLAWNRSPAAFRHVAAMVLRHLRDRLTYRRGTRLVMGNALCARLLQSLLDRDVPIWLQASAEALILDDGRVAGVEIMREGRRKAVRSRAVILATGGFSHDSGLRARLFPRPTAQHSVVPKTNSGDGLRLASALGARIGERHADNGFWAPVSVRSRADGSTAAYPHLFLDRGKPGCIAVNAAGRRFVNESTSYQLFVEAIYESEKTVPTIPAFLICDRPFIRSYGLGMVRPRQHSLRRFIDEGYLVTAPTLPELAAKLGIDGAGLATTVARHNEFAATGVDLDFGKGGNPYNRNMGDPRHRPNPCLGPIAQAPFYAVRIFPGDIGTSAGLVTNTEAQVLDGADAPIPGLYACGNDMDSMMGGVYPAPGITLGPAFTFAYVAARHIAATIGAKQA